MSTPALAPLNARIPEDLRKQLAVHCAERGITMQEAVREAIHRYLLNAAPAKKKGYRADFPLIKSTGRSLNITRELLDEAEFDGYEHYAGFFRRGSSSE